MISLLLLKIAMFSTCNFMKYQLGNYEDKNLPLASVLLFVCFFSHFAFNCIFNSWLSYRIYSVTR